MKKQMSDTSGARGFLSGFQKQQVFAVAMGCKED